MGRKFIIRTDQKSLRALLDQVVQTPEQQKYLAKLLDYQYTIMYKPGKENRIADALSRQPKDTIAQFLAISQVQFDLLDLLRAENVSSPFFLTKYKELA